jgi:hypothetical protein
MREQRRFASVCIPTLLFAYAIHAAEGISFPQQVEGRALANEALSLLTAAKFDAVADLHHFPPSYTAVEKKADKYSVAQSLAFVFGRAGSISDVRPLIKSGEYYFIAMGGGDVSYWQSISPSARHEYPYLVTFSNFGPAMVKVVVLAAGPRSGRELVSLQLGLSTSGANAKETLVRLSLDLLREMKIQTPPNIEDLVTQSMERAVVNPASIQR